MNVTWAITECHTEGTWRTQVFFGVDSASHPLAAGISDPVVITGYYLGSVAASSGSQLLGFPPIHNHHFHVYDSFSHSGGSFELVAHGDDQCLAGAGAEATFWLLARHASRPVRLRRRLHRFANPTRQTYQRANQPTNRPINQPTNHHSHGLHHYRQQHTAQTLASFDRTKP